MKNKNRLTNVSPIDGRYGEKTAELSDYFSEFALMKYRVKIEVDYFWALGMQIDFLPEDKLDRNEILIKISTIINDFDTDDALKIKAFEKTTNHDVKAVEYFLKEKFEEMGLEEYSNWIHFALTSMDIDCPARTFMLREYIKKGYSAVLGNLVYKISVLADKFKSTAMLSRTHGQAASPTTIGKELLVFRERITKQLKLLGKTPFSTKFGGATGNFNAHTVAYPKVDWEKFADEFIMKFGLERQKCTTQIDNYDNLAALMHSTSRINTILIDMCRDIWQYISMGYFKQKIVKGETGSSTMPHKVNPIDFENAEGNLGVANALFGHFAQKLPISRLQRDLSDSTVIRNMGVPFGHTLIAFKSIIKGLEKLELNKNQIEKDLEDNWAVISEAVQTILRREGVDNSYEKLKELTRTGQKITKKTLHDFIDLLEINDTIKKEMKAVTPFNYIGNANLH